MSGVIVSNAIGKFIIKACESLRICAYMRSGNSAVAVDMRHARRIANKSKECKLRAQTKKAAVCVWGDGDLHTVESRSLGKGERDLEKDFR